MFPQKHSVHLPIDVDISVYMYHTVYIPVVSFIILPARVVFRVFPFGYVLEEVIHIVLSARVC